MSFVSVSLRALSCWTAFGLLMVWVGMAGAAEGSGTQPSTTKAVSTSSSRTDESTTTTSGSEAASVTAASTSIESKSSGTTEPASDSSPSRSASKAPTYSIPQVAYINDLINQGWQANGLRPSLP